MERAELIGAAAGCTKEGGFFETPLPLDRAVVSLLRRARSGRLAPWPASLSPPPIRAGLNLKLRLKHIFVMVAVLAVWLWAKFRWPEYPGAEWTAILVTALAVARSSWATITAAFASAFCMLEFQTCACGHLASWQALGITSCSSALAWCAVVNARKSGGRCYFAVAIGVASLTTCLFATNLADLFVLGHHPIWPNSPVARSVLPSTIGALFSISVFASFGAALCMIVLNLFTWTRGMAVKRGSPTEIPAAPITSRE